VNKSDDLEVVGVVRTRARYLSLLNREWIRCVLLALVGFVVRIPALSGDRVWDDDFLTRGNPFIKSPLFVLEVFRQRLFPESYSGHYRPVQNISYMFDYLLWNGSFYGFHLSSVLFHVLAGVLLYLLLRRLVSGLTDVRPGGVMNTSNWTSPAISWLAFFVALVWVVHPVHSAAVDYVSGRADSLAAMFGAGAWLIYLRSCDGRSAMWRAVGFATAWFVALLALCSRESACLWPVLFLIHLFVFHKSMPRRQRFVTLATCLVLFGVYAALRHLPPGLSVPGQLSHWSAVQRLVLMTRALGDYGRLMVFPGNLHMERSVFSGLAVMSQAGREYFVEFEYLAIVGLSLAATFLFLSLKKGQGQRLRIFGALWFFVAYLPTSNIVELNATVAEHWLYLPSVGFLLFLAGCLIDLSRPRWHTLQIAVALAAIAALGVRSTLRSYDWRSNEEFARQTIASGGLTIRVALLLGQVYSNRGDFVEAERILRKAIKLCPEYPIARNNLAHALLNLGKTKEANDLFSESARTAQENRKDYPRTWIAALNVAHMYHAANDDLHAIETLDKARHDYPQTWELVCSETELLRRNDQVDRSLAIAEPFAKANWWNYQSYLAVGRLYAEKGSNEQAIVALRHASWLDVHETEALNLIAMIRLRQDRLGEAVAVQKRAVARQPDQPQQYILLSDLLNKAGRTREAQIALAKVDRLRALVAAN
jgi:tetratricopeptide (TPR) repeat protein